MVVPFGRIFQPIASLRPLITRSLPQVELDKLWRARARMDYRQGIPIDPANRPVASEQFSSQALPASPWEIQSYRVPSGVSPSARVLPGRSIEDVRITPSIAESYEPRIATSRPFEEEALRQWQSGAFEPRQVTVGLRGGGEMTYVPLLPDEIRDIERAVREDPGRAYLSVLTNYDEARTPQEFGRAMEQARALRQNMVMDPEYEEALNYAFARAARRFGVPETEFEKIVNPILYSNSRQLPSETAAESFTERGTRQDWAAARTDAEKYETDTRKVIAQTKRVEDLDELDTKRGGSIYRALAAGEISNAQAKKLIDQVNYRRVRLLQDKGVLPKNIKNNIKSQEGVRGIGLLTPVILRGSESAKAAIYKVAIQTSESTEELAQVYSIIRRDVTSPAYLDVLEEAMDAKTSLLPEIKGVEAVRLPTVGRATIDEDAVARANAEQAALDARRANADDTRPEFPSDEVSPEDTIVRTEITKKRAMELGEGNYERVEVPRGTNPETGQPNPPEYKYYTVEGGSSSSVVNTSLFKDPGPRPDVRKTDIRIKPLGSGYAERTFYNAQNSDATIAVARDFDSPGERLTASFARGEAGIEVNSNMKVVPYYPLPGQPKPGRRTPLFQIQHGSSDYQSSVDEIVRQLNETHRLKGEPLTINFAGNSLLNLGDKTVEGAVAAQRNANAFARRILDAIMDHPDRQFQIRLARSGGQNGYDTAFIKAASENGIPTGVTHPTGQYGGVMQANPLGEELRPIFMSEAQYLRFARGDVNVLASRVKSSGR